MNLLTSKSLQCVPHSRCQPALPKLIFWRLNRPATHSPDTRVRHEEGQCGPEEISMCWHTETHVAFLPFNPLLLSAICPSFCCTALPEETVKPAEIGAHTLFVCVSTTLCWLCANYMTSFVQQQPRNHRNCLSLISNGPDSAPEC